MSKKTRKIPVPDSEADKSEYICPSASWGDMTGLRPYAVENKDALDAYGEIYPYLPEYLEDYSGL